ncbi:M48 family metalloprotease [Sphingomonas ginsenosidivorax]|uniref:M48 family metalloprotease n=1 Tax=Sphingomonas ginsenosidivorax TaxID=862135 RepID=A0A5C6UDT8_9SPHN|nr:M48 family metallopeptidase [Sphingomonas ginsenosidivorax]TXC70882.1 M48 family metalloprotease [Sphingomonas ginsenosidivorax]
MTSRRAVIAGAACSCALAGVAHAERIHPAAMQALVGPGYRPVDADERGMWQDFAKLETEIASSNRLLGSPAMQRYTEGVIARLLGPRADEARVYLLHDPAFNAAMAPNGMMIVNTGLLARCRDEAQFATVLGHECAHYLRRHSLQRWRDRRTKTGIMAFVGATTGLVAGVAAAAGAYPRTWIDVANAINGALVLSIMHFTRAQEAEADAYGVRLIEEAGYPPGAAAAMWQQVIEERRASARARGKRYRDAARSAMSSHPPNQERMLDLSASARELEAASVPPRRYDGGRDAWRDAVAPLRAALLDEQIKMNDPGVSLYLVHALARDGWDGTLRYCEGEAYRLRDEPGDAARAAAAYASAVASDDAPPEAWRAHGYALVKAGDAEGGRTSLARYLERKPGAADAAMIRGALAP